jgi:hypothetical protein
MPTRSGHPAGRSASGPGAATLGEPRTLGWREWVGLPDLGIDSVKAKVDTGARSSSLHAWDVEILGGRDGPMVRFVLHPAQRDMSLTVTAEAPLVDVREVRSSNGDVERRPVIRTRIVVGRRRFTVDLSLTRRDEMGFRMLLGRQALRRRFVVDPRRSFIGGGTTVAPPVA